MHDSENGTHSATAAETLVLTNNLVYSEPSSYFDHVINHHHNHNSYHHNYHSQHHHHLQNLHINHIQSHSYHSTQYSHEASLSDADISNNNDVSLHQDQSTPVSEPGSTLITPHPEPQQHQQAHNEQLITLPYPQLDVSSSLELNSKQISSETHFVDDIMIDGSHCHETNEDDGIKANEYTTLPSSETNILELEKKLSVVSETLNVGNCNTESKIVTPDPNTSLLASSFSAPSQAATDTIILDTQPQSSPPREQFHSLTRDLTKADDDCSTTYDQKNDLEEEEVEEEEEEEEEEDEDELVDDEDENEDEEEEDGDDEDDEDGEDDEDDISDDDSEDIVDPGQNCQLVQNAFEGNNLVEHGETIEGDNDALDGERLLEVTRKLVRSTERDPDRDLRKQVLLKTAIKKLPHFMEYNHYSDSLDRSFHNNMTPQAYCEHHDSQQKFYHSVQPNAIQMSTTSLRMLDLNDDQDPELNSIEQGHPDSSLCYGTRTSSDQHDYVNQNQYERYNRTQDNNHYETNSPMISRHNSLDNLYQPLNGHDIGEDVKDGDEKIPIAFQIACELYDFTCAPDDNDRKLLDNLTDGYYIRPTKKPRLD